MQPQRLARLKAELAMLVKDPPPGIHCWQDEKQVDMIHVDMTGPENSPFADGVFRLQVTLSENYPFTPPLVKFVTQIYHPNIDSCGRICLAALKPKPTGTWSVIMNIPTLLSGIRVLLAEPNVMDPLMASIAQEFMEDNVQYRKTALEHTQKYASRKISQAKYSPVCINRTLDDDHSFWIVGGSKSYATTLKVEVLKSY